MPRGSTQILEGAWAVQGRVRCREKGRRPPGNLLALPPTLTLAHQVQAKGRPYLSPDPYCKPQKCQAWAQGTEPVRTDPSSLWSKHPSHPTAAAPTGEKLVLPTPRGPWSLSRGPSERPPSPGPCAVGTQREHGPGGLCQAHRPEVPTPCCPPLPRLPGRAAAAREVLARRWTGVPESQGRCEAPARSLITTFRDTPAQVPSPCLRGHSGPRPLASPCLTGLWALKVKGLRRSSEVKRKGGRRCPYSGTRAPAHGEGHEGPEQDCPQGPGHGPASGAEAPPSRCDPRPSPSRPPLPRGCTPWRPVCKSLILSRRRALPQR